MSTEQRTGDDEDAVRSVVTAASAAWGAGNGDAFAASYAVDATAILPGFHLRGRAELRDRMAQAFAGPLKNTRRIHAVESVRFLAADVAILVTHSSTVRAGETQAPVERRSLATWVLSRRGGPWLVESYHDCPAN